MSVKRNVGYKIELMLHFDVLYPIKTEQYHLDRNLDCNLDSDPEDVPVYTGHSLFNTTKRITLLFIAQSVLHHNPPNSLIKIIQITECLHVITFLDCDLDLDCDPDNFAPCKQVLDRTRR